MRSHQITPQKTRYPSIAIAAAVVLITLASVSSCTTYKALPSSAEEHSTGTSLHELHGWLVVAPGYDLEILPDTAMVFYPGALVESTAYIPLARTIAAQAKILVIIVPMPLDLAVLAPKRGASVPEAFPQVTTWYASGHSLGGAMAASLVKSRTDLFSGLVLLAAYPADSASLALSETRVLSLAAEHDGLATDEKINARRQLLPPDTIYAVIKGANHAGFGNYGPQKGDGLATISKEDQWDAVAAQIAIFLHK